MGVLHYQISSKNNTAPLVILHGLFASQRNWQSISGRLEMTTIRLDLRNHGQSFHDTQMSFELMVADLEALRQYLNLEKIHLLGHSLGGKVAMLYALRYPERSLSLSIIDIAAQTYQLDFLPIIKCMQQAVKSIPWHRRAVLDYLREQLQDEALAQFLLTSNFGAEGWKLNLEAIKRNLPELLGFPQFSTPLNYSGKVLLLSGGASSFVSAKGLQTTHFLFPKMEHRCLEKAAHSPHFECPELFCQHLKEFLGI